MTISSPSRIVDAADVAGAGGGWATIAVSIDLHERLTKAVEWRVNRAGSRCGCRSIPSRCGSITPGWKCSI